MENKTKHTPGEWFVGRTELFKGGDSMVVSPKNQYLTDEGYRSICQVSPMEDVDDEDYANALLIAAAPDMLQVLQGIIKSWEVLSEGNYTPKQINDWLANDMKPEIDKAREIIKKATGDE